MTDSALLAVLEDTEVGGATYAGHESRMDDWMNLSSIVLSDAMPTSNHPTVSTCTCGCQTASCQPNSPPTPCGC
jgi:hypothetical protein